MSRGDAAITHHLHLVRPAQFGEALLVVESTQESDAYGHTATSTDKDLRCYRSPDIIVASVNAFIEGYNLLWLRQKR
jgi:hypothetical protein